MTGWFLSAKAVWADEVASAFLGDTYEEVNTGEDSVAKFVIIITIMERYTLLRSKKEADTLEDTAMSTTMFALRLMAFMCLCTPSWKLC
jgi:hypothetical protein